MMKYKTQWRVLGLLNLHKHGTEDRKGGDASIKARSSCTSNAGFFILSSLKEEWVFIPKQVKVSCLWRET